MLMSHKKSQSFVHWAYNRDNSSDPKYNTYTHALFITITHTIVFLIVSMFIRYSYFQFDTHSLRSEAPLTGIFLIFYLAFMMGTRVYQNGPTAIYQFLWACNQCMILAAIGLMTGDSVLVRVALVGVSVDQILWYVDLCGYLVIRKFIVGVAKYIIWPQTSRMRLLTTFHHVWFLPLCLWQIHPSSIYSTFDQQVYILSFIISFTLTMIGRMSTPKEIIIAAHGKKQQRKVYMNINISWQLWKDVRIGLFEYLYGVVPSQVVVLVISFFWNIGSFFGLLVFWCIENLTK